MGLRFCCHQKPGELPGLHYRVVKGSRASIRARLMAVESARWCFAQMPVFRGGKIFAWADVNFRMVSVSLKSMYPIFFVQKKQWSGLGRWCRIRNGCRRLRRAIKLEWNILRVYLLWCLIIEVHDGVFVNNRDVLFLCRCCRRSAFFLWRRCVRAARLI